MMRTFLACIAVLLTLSTYAVAQSGTTESGKVRLAKKRATWRTKE